MSQQLKVSRHTINLVLNIPVLYGKIDVHSAHIVKPTLTNSRTISSCQKSVLLGGFNIFLKAYTVIITSQSFKAYSTDYCQIAT